MSGLKEILNKLRWHLRRQPFIARLAYAIPNAWWALRAKPPSIPAPNSGVALCLRFRDEAIFLDEWLAYYLAAGVDHFYLYNNFSADQYLAVLAPYVERGCVTLIDWPFSPASPAAENDCIGRAVGRYEWVGFLDADEFVVVRDGRSIPEFLAGFQDSVPAVGLHWYYFGSAGHVTRPAGWVINSYIRRHDVPDPHYKVFVRPERVTRNRNSHNFYYVAAGNAVSEVGKKLHGSMDLSPSAERAWINHYVHKSREDYLAKAMRKSTLDKSGINSPARQAALVDAAMMKANTTVDSSAAAYYDLRSRRCQT